MAKLNVSSPGAQVADIAESPQVLTLRDPFTKELLSDAAGAVTITLIGAAGRTAQKKRRAFQNRRVANIARVADDVAAYTEETSVELLASLTRGWTGIEDDTGPIAFSREAAESLYRDLEWIRIQVDAFVSDLSNYGSSLLGNLRASSSPSASTPSNSIGAPEGPV